MIGPNAGEMAEAGEAGVGRMAEPGNSPPRRTIFASAAAAIARRKRVLITAGPTHEPIDRCATSQPLLRQAGFAIRPQRKPPAPMWC